MHDELLTMRDILKIFRKRLHLIIAIIIVTTVAAGLYTEYSILPQYKTNIRLFVGKSTEAVNQGYTSGELTLYQKLTTTFSGLVRSEDLIERAITDKNVGMTAKQILGALQVISSESEQFITLTVSTFDPKKGKEILELITDELIKTSKELVPNVSIQVISTPKVPQVPFNINKKKNLILGFAAGLMIAITLSLLLEYFDNTVKDKNKVEKLLGVPVIGTVIDFDSEKVDKNNYNKYIKQVKGKEINQIIDTDLVSRKQIKEKNIDVHNEQKETYIEGGGANSAKRGTRSKK